ncbi:MAG: alkaline phosphatase family protein [Gaiellaceae bacterium]|jgi:2,3-bisphosphoglycerate-independent phosphoglycerate mutase
MYPIVVVLLDGLADRAHDVLKGRTANEAARTPNLDRFAAAGSCGLLHAVGPGRAPSSEVAHWAMLGYRPDEFPGRAVFEALGREQDVSPEHVFAYAALRPAQRRDDGWWLTGRPDPKRDAADAQALVDACDGLEVDGLLFTLAHLWRGEAVLRIEGEADDRITDTDAFFRDRHPVLRPLALAPEAERTARATEEWTRWTMELLAEHEITKRRAEEGLPVFNVVTLKWWGRPRRVPTFEERHGLRGTFIGASAFLRGLAKSVGLQTVEAAESENAEADLARRLDIVDERLVGGETFVFVHQKATDAAGHTKDPLVKRAVIEALDVVLHKRLPVDRAIVCITGDHATPASPDVIHSGDPVPFLVAGPGVRADNVRRFGELDCAAGIFGRLRGPDMMPVLLNAADRPLFLGSRPTPFDGADGYPSLLEPLG